MLRATQISTDRFRSCSTLQDAVDACFSDLWHASQLIEILAEAHHRPEDATYSDWEYTVDVFARRSGRFDQRDRYVELDESVRGDWSAGVECLDPVRLLTTTQRLSNGLPLDNCSASS